MHEPDVAGLKARLTRQQWKDWERFYEQDPWGEVRQDLRAMAVLISQWGKDTETQMVWPYWQSDEDATAEYAEGKAAIDAIGAERIQELLRIGQEKHRAAKEAAKAKQDG